MEPSESLDGVTDYMTPDHYAELRVDEFEVAEESPEESLSVEDAIAREVEDAFRSVVMLDDAARRLNGVKDEHGAETCAAAVRDLEAMGERAKALANWYDDYITALKLLKEERQELEDSGSEDAAA